MELAEQLVKLAEVLIKVLMEVLMEILTADILIKLTSGTELV